MKEFLVLFGAGAEYGYKLPSGAKYTKDTILTKNTTLYEHLEKYYKNPGIISVAIDDLE